MDLGPAFPGKVFQSDEQQDGTADNHGIADRHRKEIRHNAAQDYQHQREELHYKVSKPETKPRKAPAVLFPQDRHDDHTNEIADRITEDHGSRVKQVHETPLFVGWLPV